MTPPDDVVARTRRQARHYAYAHGQGQLAEDFEQEAVYALLKHWPGLVRNYGADPGKTLMRRVVRNWIVDYYRSTVRRGAARGPADPWPFEAFPGWEPAATDDVEEQALAGWTGPKVGQIIDVVCHAYEQSTVHATPSATANRRKTLRLVAEGCERKQIAREVGVSENMVYRYLRDAVQAGRQIPELERWATAV